MVRVATDPTGSYYANMPRKKRALPNRAAAPDWFLPEWMETLEISQAKLAKKMGVPPNTVHGIYHGRTAYYRDLLNEVARALNVETYELLMHPDAAMSYRRQREAALRIVETTQAEKPAAPANEASPPVRRVRR